MMSARMLFYSTMITASVAAPMLAQEQKEENPSVYQVYKNMPADRVACLKKDAQKGDLESMLHYALYSLANKKFDDAFLWMEVVSSRAQLQEVESEGSLEDFSKIAMIMLSSILMELRELDDQFEKQFEQAVEKFKIQGNARAMQMVEKLETARPKDEHTAKRKTVLNELKKQQ